jgi:UDP:flavonoid glycosyltransferase YjiC (YdhE family)
VLVAAPRELGPRIEGDGYPHWPFADPPQEEVAAALERSQSAPDAAKQEAQLVGELFGRRAAHSLPRLLEACETWRPDVVVRESNQFGAAIAAELHGVPHARVGLGVALMEEYTLRLAAPTIDTIRSASGLDPDPGAERLRRSPYLTCTAASLEDPDGALQPNTHRFRDPAWDAPASPLRSRWRWKASQPLVYVSFGTVVPSREALRPVYGATLEAVADLPVRVLMTYGGVKGREWLPRPPANVRVESWVEQSDALAAASTVVHHGGAGSTTGALAAGVPAVVVPMFADQPYNAQAVERVGAGVSVDSPTPDAIRDALQRVLEQRRYARSAAKMAEEMRRSPPTDAVVDLLASL